MKVKKLIAILQKLNQNAEVFLASDSEGNSYGKLDSFGGTKGMKYAKLDDSNDLVDYPNQFYTEEDIVEKPQDSYEITQKEYNKLKDCIILYPA